jgi:hypothetical protein
VTREAIDTLFDLERERVEAAEHALAAARDALERAEAALAAAERELLTHDEDVARRRASAFQASETSVTALARMDGYVRDMRARRDVLTGNIRTAHDHKAAEEGALEAARQTLADARARKKAIEARLDARAKARKKAMETREDDEADERRRP